jgi:hypothetical protein
MNRDLPDADIHAYDLSSAVNIVEASRSVFAPDAIAERWLFPGPQRSTRSLKRRFWILSAPPFILAVPGLRTKYL